MLAKRLPGYHFIYMAGEHLNTKNSARDTLDKEVNRTRKEQDMELFTQFAEMYDRNKIEEMTLQEYLLGCRDDSMMRATAAENRIRLMACSGRTYLPKPKKTRIP